jgi:hypothetical protein
MRRLAAVLLILAVACLAAHADVFVPGTEDLPLMPGLTAVANSGVVFDKPQGRIVEVQASGKVSRSAVQSFYGATLPQLGWKSAGANAWQREGELLRLDFHGRDGDLTVGFSLSPL